MTTLPNLAEVPTLNVNEIFGITGQGEGPDIGKACVFLRTQTCPVQCKDCDTFYTWDGSEKGTKMTFSDIAARLNEIRGDNPGVGIVVSGGEPLLHYRNPHLRVLLQNGNWAWRGLETSGYAGHQPPIEPALWSFLNSFTTVSLSPKITPCLHGRQTDVELESWIPTILRVCNHTNLVLKFVVRDRADIDAVLSCEARHNFMHNHVTYLMPYGQERDEILRAIETLIPAAAKYGFVITPRLHSILWGKERKR